MSGSHIAIAGNVRSNGNVAFSGSDVSIAGAISYGGSSNIAQKVASSGVAFSAAPVATGLPWTISDFAPGGRYSTLPGYVAHADSLTVKKGDLSPGVHYVAGDVSISASAPELTGVTIVATGRIVISGATAMTPARVGLPTLLAGGGSCWLNAIELNGSHLSWTGVIAAPGGGIQIGSSEVVGGRAVGGTITMSGSNVTLG
jgi:hypothetical protein